jgi:hypothetical protein
MKCADAFAMQSLTCSIYSILLYFTEFLKVKEFICKSLAKRGEGEIGVEFLLLIQKRSKEAGESGEWR